MSSFFKLVLDTTGPVNPGLSINSSLPTASERMIPAQFFVEDPEPIKGFQVKIWGDVDPTGNPDIQLTEGESAWINWTGEELNSFFEFLLSEGDGIKTIHGRIRDDVWNESGELTAEVELNTTIPVITITTGPTRSKISEITGKDAASFTFKASEDLMAWTVEVVETSGDTHGTGSVIHETHGSEETDKESGAELAAETNQTVKIEGLDLSAAVGSIDAEYTIKVFGQSKANALWSA